MGWEGEGVAKTRGRGEGGSGTGMGGKEEGGRGSEGERRDNHSRYMYRAA